MKVAHNVEGQLRPVAEESLSTFEEVANAARSEMNKGNSSISPSAFGAINTLTSTAAIANSNKISEANAEGYRLLAEEPAIARVVVADENGERTTYYFCRTTPLRLPKEGRGFASYRSPVGRLAELGVGDEHAVQRNGQEVWVEVIEHARFWPNLAGGDWDSFSILEGEGYGQQTVTSLRSLLDREETVDATALDKLLMEESSEENIREGVRRTVLSKMDLRDQPILDKYQGEIFRLPLNSRLLLLGAPGTGKTTTLIRRLGQKLDSDALDDAEKRMVQNSASGELAKSWIMFTPTELLRLYIKEAFNREDIPAPDGRIRTWDDFRNELARNEFRILRSSASSSALVMKSHVASLKDGTQADQISWFTDFNDWQLSTFWGELREAGKQLEVHPSREISSFGGRIVAILDAAGSTPSAAVFVRLTDVADEIRTVVDDMKDETDKKIRGALNLQVNRDGRFLDDLAEFITSLGDVSDDTDDQEMDEEEEVVSSRVPRAAALAAYMRAIRSQARASARKRGVSKSGSTGKTLDWIGDRTLAPEDLNAVGQSLIIQGQLRALANPIRRYVDGIPSRYRRFRRERQSEGIWYRPQGFSGTELNPLEVDVILLAMMKASDGIIVGASSLVEAEIPAKPVIDRMAGLYRTQVLVDEATDFSPIQLACMATLARPGIRSFFACGDFNQRVTSWGTRTSDEMDWVIPDLSSKRISVAYRQSAKLREFADRIVQQEVNTAGFTDEGGELPVLVENLIDPEAVAMWLAQRIVEIEKSLGQLPTIAVLVNSEESVRPTASALGEALTDFNIGVEACPDGKVKGRDGTVRVFNIEHIKGLEFEAVFFVAVDQLAVSEPDLFEKYLYVGATRAATYLGMTCMNGLPAQIGNLEYTFSENWK